MGKKFSFSQRSEDRLKNLHPDMLRVVRRALSYGVLDFTVAETVRSAKRQADLLAQGMTLTLKSKHLPDANGLSRAVDLVPYPGEVNGLNVWSDKERFARLAGLVQAAAAEEGVKIRWGGDWDGDGNNLDSRLHDMPHFEMV